MSDRYHQNDSNAAGAGKETGAGVPPMPEPPWPLLDRYLSGECSAEEVTRFERWAASDSRRQQVIDTYRALKVHSVAPAASWDVEAFLARAGREQLRPSAAPLRIVPAGVSGPWNTGRRFSWRGATLSVVAAGLVVAGAALLRERVLTGRASSVVRVATRPGERATLGLPDGTQVTLAPQSRLSYDSLQYGGTRREVTLTGAAYFEVTHNGAHPFVVQSPRATATDLGTAFLVRDYGGAAPAVVVVASGAVAVRRTQSQDAASGTDTRLTAGDLASVGPAGPPVVQHGIDPTDYVAWRTGTLVYRAVPLGDVVRDVERWYGASVELADSGLASVSVTATFDNQPFERVVAILARVVDLDYTIVGRHVQLRAAHGRVGPSSRTSTSDRRESKISLHSAGACCHV